MAPTAQRSTAASARSNCLAALDAGAPDGNAGVTPSLVAAGGAATGAEEIADRCVSLSVSDGVEANGVGIDTVQRGPRAVIAGASVAPAIAQIQTK